MFFVPTPGFMILAATACGAVLVSRLLWRRRSLPGGKTLSLLMVAVSGWVLVSALEAGSVARTAKVVWSTLEYVGSGTTAVLFLVFALRYCGYKIRSRSRWSVLLIIGPAVNVVIAATNSVHGLLWTGFSPGPAGSNMLVYHHGPLYVVALIILFAYLFPGTCLLIRTAFRKSIVQRRQASAILLSAAAPWIGALVYSLELPFLEGVNLVPMSFALSGLVLSTSIAGLRHFDVIPVARDALVESMDDAVFVLDTDHRIIDVNPAACALLRIDNRVIGQPVQDALHAWPQIAKFGAQTDVSQCELTLCEDPPRAIDIRTAPILRARGTVRKGQLVVLRDITKRLLAQREASETNEQLRRKISRIEALQVELREQSIRDMLTGLFNRRYLEECLPRELFKADRLGQSLSVILFDLDGFKKLNDSQGHHAGDDVLRAIGTTLFTTAGEGDIPCRYGGDEFIVILPDTSQEGAILRAETLRKEIGKPSIPDFLSVSFGIASFPNHGETADQLLRAADRALYVAKDAGKNRVCTA